ANSRADEMERQLAAAQGEVTAADATAEALQRQLAVVEAVGVEACQAGAARRLVATLKNVEVLQEKLEAEREARQRAEGLAQEARSDAQAVLAAAEHQAVMHPAEVEAAYSRGWEGGKAAASGTLRAELMAAWQAQHAAEQETVAARRAQRRTEERAQQERRAWEEKVEAAQQATAAAAAALQQEREQRAAAQALAERRGGEAEAVLQMLACARAAVPPAPAPASYP
ncbi:hypothetical protein ABPG75_003509, partial [Micractinium tetrahymenae]